MPTSAAVWGSVPRFRIEFPCRVPDGAGAAIVHNNCNVDITSVKWTIVHAIANLLIKQSHWFDERKRIGARRITVGPTVTSHT